MPRLTAGVLTIALLVTACSVEPIEDPGIGAGDLTTTVFAADGSVLAEWHAAEDRLLVGYDELPTHLIDAVVAIEDRRFWVHTGVDVRSMARATVENLEAGDIVEGGSTITQQYVKNVLLGGEVTLERKAEEIGLALQIEETLTKQEIVERYLNTIYLGEGAYGVAAAAKRYFGKAPRDLTLGESALLAGLINEPSRLNPYDNLDGALNRRDLVLDLMVELGWTDVGAAIRASAEPVVLIPRGSADRMRFPYFTDEVRRRLLENPALGATPEERWARVTRGGLTIYTTLDPAVQMAAETAMSSLLPAGGPDGALVAIDPRNGAVLAIVGGRDFYDPDDPIAQFNLATQGRRQPGSAFKPFALAAALQAGVSLDSTWPGGRSTVLRTPTGLWEVTNHEAAAYPPLTLQEASVFSVNVPYAHLVDWIGAERVVQMAHDLGIQSPLTPTPVIALGVETVTVFEMAAAYATIAAGGIRTAPTLISRIVDRDGTVLYQHLPTFTRALDAAVAEDITATLTEAVRRGTGQQAKIGRPIAGKTGTTEGNHDAWFVGYTPELSAAVWVGYANGNTPLVSPHTPYTITGGSWPAQIWSRFAIAALGGVGYTDPPEVLNELVTVEIDTSTGFLAGPLCPRATVATVGVHRRHAPTIVCPIHNPEGIGLHPDGTVPSVEFFSTVDAVALLESSGYRVRLVWGAETGYLPGTVLGQFPAAGTVRSGGDVELIIAGPEPGTTVPDVIGRNRYDAQVRLEAVGLVVTVVVLAPVDPTVGSGVWSQSPASGELANGRATIWVSP